MICAHWNSAIRAAIERSRTFSACKKGMAAVEFGLVAPIMILMFIGVVELSQVITADRRMNQVMSSTADLVARQNSMTDVLLGEYTEMVAAIMAPYPTAPLKMTVMSIYAPSAGQPAAPAAPTDIRVCWAYQYQTGAIAATAGNTTPISVPTGLINSGGTGVVAVEISYIYTPAVAFGTSIIGTSKTLTGRFFLKPRTTSIVQKTTGSVPATCV